MLAGSAAYALGEARHWKVGLSRRPAEAKAFYITIAAATLLGALANFFHISPIKALVWAAAINAVTAAPIMVLIMRLAGNASVMGRFRIGRASCVLGYLATGVMALASIAFLVSLIPGRG